jgi:DNA-directed RNA polymerase specialized sigma24 family protein
MRDVESPITTVGSFEVFFNEAEPRLHDALSACLGGELGREATADALVFGWENWERVGSMDNPVGYLYVVGRNRGRKARRTRRAGLPLVEGFRLPWIEPGLVDALAGLPERQRVVVTLVYGFEWTLAEVADLLGLKKTTVQNHADRGLSKLRSKLGVGA